MLSKKYQSCFFTGHRIIPAEKYPEIQKSLEGEVINLINQGVRWFYAGGALGFDTMAAQTILSLKRRFPHIILILVLPCKNQTKDWPEKDKKIYGEILRQADKAVYTSESYYSGCMHRRNRYMVDCSDVGVCYLTNCAGGTAHTVNYASQKGLPLIYLSADNP